ncbi:MAG: putative lipid II flippase FtsW [Gammaproteobacteria bacterium]
MVRSSKSPSGIPEIVRHVDPALVLLIGTILCVGLVMLTSASISLAERNTGNPFFFFERQLGAVFLGLLGAIAMLHVASRWWERAGLVLVILAVGMLILVLVPGFGNTVNGSTRWLSVGGVNVMQVSEPARLLMLMYISGYAVRHRVELRSSFVGFLKPMLLVGAVGGLLLLEPDFGASVVMASITLSVLFVAGARLRDFFAFSLAAGCALTVMAVASPYRMARIMAFWNPWADPYDTGFQLTQSLIAIGSGAWTGAGLGGSVQKLFYLPEAHTDFVFAVIAEEFGLVGSLVVILLFGMLVWKVLRIARESAATGRLYQANLAFGFAVWQAAQAFINIGVNMGILPTKGLTLPLVSYGRSSLVVTLVGLGLLMRIDCENRRIEAAGRSKRRAAPRKSASRKRPVAKRKGR